MLHTAILANHSAGSLSGQMHCACVAALGEVLLRLLLQH